MISLIHNSTQYSGFISAEVDFSMASLARTFYIEVARSSIEEEKLPFRADDLVEVLSDGVVICTGYIDIVTSKHKKSSRTITVEGRSKSADLIDSSLEPITFSADINLKGIIEKVIDQLGLDIKVVNNVKDLRLFKKESDKIVVRAGDNAFSFIDSWAVKSQVLLTGNARGDIVIENTPSNKYSQTLEIFNVSAENKHFVKESTVSHNHSNRYREYIGLGQLNASAEGFSFSEEQTTNQKATAKDNAVRPRRKVFSAGKASSQEELQKQADWYKNMARAKSVSFSIITAEHNYYGQPWEINKLLHIKDQINDFEDTLAIDEVHLAESKKEGATATIHFTDKDAYASISIDKAKKEDNSLASLF
jgi:prophage tail gpP-like protein